MAVLAIFTGALTKAQYDMLRKEVDWENKHPNGAVFHAASFDDNGQIHVADIWDSPEALNDFAQNRLMPTFAKHNIAPPTVMVNPAHKIIAYPAVAAYNL